MSLLVERARVTTGAAFELVSPALEPLGVQTIEAAGPENVMRL